MFRRKNKIEVVPESEYTDFSHRDPKDAYATRKTVAIAAIVPTAASVGLLAHRLSEGSGSVEQIITASAPVIEQAPIVFTPQYAPLQMANTPEMIPTGFVADKSLEMLANVLDPVIQILVAISFPIASVIMIGACFFFMFGNSEKAWSMIMNAGLGYVLIQLSPLFLDILRKVGEAV